jgi:CPA1 family monovalent cation:H+ antiporter
LRRTRSLWRDRLRLRRQAAIREFHAGRLPGRFRTMTWQETLEIGWTGMRGIVTLATAGQVPHLMAGGYDGKVVVMAVAYTVAVGTIVLQGFTLPVLAKRLNVDTSDEEAHRHDQEKIAERILRGCGPTDFDQMRAALSDAVISLRLDDQVASEFIHRIDLAQAALEPEDDLSEDVQIPTQPGSGSRHVFGN